jgi:PQQ-dependent catabolism-associated CXXCW motif protein
MKKSRRRQTMTPPTPALPLTGGGNVVRFALLAAALLSSGALAGEGDEPVPEPAGYRMDDYRAPTPATVAGGTTLTTEELRRLLERAHVIVIDVLPLQQRPEGLPEDTLWMPQVRRNIPGSIWLPEVGRGALNPAVEGYFRRHLERLTEGDRGRGLVFYCLADCWMSWNAAKRAISFGYTRVYWYPDGTDGWTAAGLPTEVSEPMPLP